MHLGFCLSLGLIILYRLIINMIAGENVDSTLDLPDLCCMHLTKYLSYTYETWWERNQYLKMCTWGFVCPLDELSSASYLLISSHIGFISHSFSFPAACQQSTKPSWFSCRSVLEPFQYVCYTMYGKPFGPGSDFLEIWMILPSSSGIPRHL